MFVRQFVHEALGNSSYLVASEESRTAAVVDPQRDVEQYLDAARARGVRISHIFDTHLHNDYISGARELSAATGAVICMNTDARLHFPHVGLHHSRRVQIGDMTIEARHTPGHTFEHMAYVAHDGDGPPRAIFSGGSLLVGGVARSDLLGQDNAERLARAMYNSVHEHILSLPDDVTLYPTHGGGSFCVSGGGGERSSTIGEQRAVNPAVHLPSEDEFAATVLAGLPPYPRYYARMAPINRAGPVVLGGLPRPRPLSPQGVRALLAGGATAVDTRAPARFVQEHIPGAISIEGGGSFASWVGWLLTLETRLVLVVEAPDGAVEAIRDLVRIGFERVEGFLDGGIESWKAAGLATRSMRLETPDTLRARLAQGRAGVQLVDVRFADEYAEAHVPGARHIMLGDLPSSAPTLDPGAETLVICGVGPRATTGASLLERAGFQRVAPVLGGTSGWRRAGYPTERAATRAHTLSPLAEPA